MLVYQKKGKWCYTPLGPLISATWVSWDKHVQPCMFLPPPSLLRNMTKWLEFGLVSRLGWTFSSSSSLLGCSQRASGDGERALRRNLAYRIISSWYWCVNGEDRCLTCTSPGVSFLMANKENLVSKSLRHKRHGLIFNHFLLWNFFYSLSRVIYKIQHSISV